MEKTNNKKVKYEDYLLMSLDEQDKEYMPHEFIRNISVTFMEYFSYILGEGLSEIETHIMESIQLKKWCKYSDDDIINSILPKTEIERKKKKENKDYYLANGICAFETLKYIFTKELYSKLEQSPTFIQNNYYLILKYLILDIDQLINEYENNINHNYKYHANANRPIHTMSLHNVLRQSAYGRASFHSFADIEIDASIAIIRQMIELRIRRAFGTLALVDDKENIIPLDMSSIFDILKKYDDIKFPGKLSSLIRIYKWSNLYIHSGRGDYSWITYFLERYLRMLSFGETKPDGSWCYNNGISLSKGTYDCIIHDIESLNDKFKILSCKPECEIT